LSAAPQAVIFDFGGVMTGEVQREIVVQFLRSTLNLSAKEYEKAVEEKRAALIKGPSDEGYWLDYAQRKGIALSPQWSEQFKQAMKEALGIDASMFVLVEELKQKQLTVGLLSNIDKRLSLIVRELGLYEPFNPCLLSWEIGVEKPNPQAYHFLLDHLKLPASEVIFVDDRLENVTAAQKAGIDAIWFKSPLQLRFELRQRGVF
jgi:putative hydrolase of the HAD superfamily